MFVWQERPALFRRATRYLRQPLLERIERDYEIHRLIFAPSSSLPTSFQPRELVPTLRGVTARDLT